MWSFYLCDYAIFYEIAYLKSHNNLFMMRMTSRMKAGGGQVGSLGADHISQWRGRGWLVGLTVGVRLCSDSVFTFVHRYLF